MVGWQTMQLTGQQFKWIDSCMENPVLSTKTLLFHFLAQGGFHRTVHHYSITLEVAPTRSQGQVCMHVVSIWEGERKRMGLLSSMADQQENNVLRLTTNFFSDLLSGQSRTAIRNAFVRC